MKVQVNTKENVYKHPKMKVKKRPKTRKSVRKNKALGVIAETLVIITLVAGLVYCTFFW